MPKKVDLTITQGRERPRDIIAKAERLSSNDTFNEGGVLGGGGGIGTGGPGFATDCPDCLPDCADGIMGQGEVDPVSISMANSDLVKCIHTGLLSRDFASIYCGRGSNLPGTESECSGGSHNSNNHFSKLIGRSLSSLSAGYDGVKIQTKARWPASSPPIPTVHFYANVAESSQDLGLDCESDFTDWTSGGFAGEINFSQTHGPFSGFVYDNTVHTLYLPFVPTTDYIRVEAPDHESLASNQRIQLLDPTVDFSSGGIDTDWKVIGFGLDPFVPARSAGYVIGQAALSGFVYELPVGAKEIDAVWFDDLPASRFLHWNIAENNAIEPVQTLQPSTVVRARFLPYE